MREGIMDLKELMNSESLRVQQLDALVKESIAEEEMLSSKLLELERDERLTLGQKIADKVADFGGSWIFIISFMFLVVLWISLNTIWARNQKFDPYPFILLNLILSCIAALQAPVIMMSQNRQEDKDRQRSRSDFMVNLKAELEIRGLHRKIDLLISDEMKTLFQVQQTQVELLLKIQSQLDERSGGQAK
jgi:uncharacterized membrane protein